MIPADYLPLLMEEAQDITRRLKELLGALLQQPTTDILYQAVNLAHALSGMAGAFKSRRFQETSVTLESWLVSLFNGQEPLTPHTVQRLLATLEVMEQSLVGKAPASPDSVRDLQVTLVSHCRLKGLRARQVLDVLGAFGEICLTVPPLADLETERFGKDFTVRLRSTASLFEIRQRILGIGDIANLEPVNAPQPSRQLSSPREAVPIERFTKELAALQGKDIRFTFKQLELVPKILMPLVQMLVKEAIAAIDTPHNRLRLGRPPQGELFLAASQEGCKRHIELRLTGHLPAPKMLAVLEPHGGAFKVQTSGDLTVIIIRWPEMPSRLDAMLIEAGGIPFAVPLGWVEEAVDLAEYPIHDEKLFLRGEAFPVIRLSQRFALPSSPFPPIGLLLKTQAGRLGIIADVAVGQKSLVPKTMSKLLGTLPTLEGASVLENGRIAFWLDIPALLEAR